MSNTNTYTSSVFTQSDITSLLNGNKDMTYAQFNHYSYSLYAPINTNEWSIGIGYKGNISIKVYNDISTLTINLIHLLFAS